jgi:hypothetical protein
MRLALIAALLTLASLPALAGTVTIHAPGYDHEVEGTVYIETVAATGSFNVLAGSPTDVTSTAVSSQGSKPEGFRPLTGAVQILSTTNAVTFTGCILMSSQAQETGLTFAEIWCGSQFGSF